MTDDIAKALAAPFDPALVSWRVGATNRDKTKGMALAYIDARDVMNRLDAVCGVFGWQTEHVIEGKRTMCRLSIRNPETGEWISRTDGCGDSDVEPEKGSFSDSLKRAAVNFGVGRYLYDTQSPWVDLEQRGNSHFIPDRELKRLAGVLARPDTAPARPQTSATPAETARTATLASAPPHPEEPPEASEARQSVGERLDRIDRAIAAAPNLRALDAVMDDNSAELVEIEGLGGDWQQSVWDIRKKAYGKASQFQKTKAA